MIHSSSVLNIDRHCCQDKPLMWFNDFLSHKLVLPSSCLAPELIKVTIQVEITNFEGSVWVEGQILLNE